MYFETVYGFMIFYFCIEKVTALSYRPINWSKAPIKSIYNKERMRYHPAYNEAIPALCDLTENCDICCSDPNQQTQALLDALGQLVQGQRALQNDAATAASPLPQPQHAVAPPFRPFDAALESWTEWSRQFGFHLAVYRIQGLQSA
ncbi:uncharacterized protein LOC126475469 isoform X3 [Schistocerca serialis cubense]|uniref:uncharacterized protein LOC126475469 isoform X3 n=1 Tax=Schistocerca serialis cubense TaxID=2023355 RepID=UPI00214EC0A4|nr:uncharacterized protein LOC126475469 isoform X3 [Schistocerca serialis cubense]